MQTIEYMKIMGYATEREAKQAQAVWRLLEPCLKLQSRELVMTAIGEKTALGLLRGIVNAMEVE